MNKPIPIKDKINLGPIEKYIKYDKFPIKLTLHLLLLLFITIEAYSL